MDGTPRHQPARAKPPIALGLPSSIGIHAAQELAWIGALTELSDHASMARENDGTMLAWNAAACRLYGYTSAEAVGQSIAILVPPEAREEFGQIMERSRRGEQIQNLETVRLRKDGSRVDISLTVSPVMGLTGRVIGASLIHRDLAERKRREAELFENTVRLRAVLDMATSAIVTAYDGQGSVQTLYPATELPISSMHHEVRPPSTDPLETKVFALPSPVDPARAANELARLAAVVDSTDTAIIAKNLDGTIVLWNAAAERLYGYTPAEAVGRPIAMLVPPEAWDEYEQVMERVRRGERIGAFEAVRRRKDGSRVHVSLAISPLRDSGGGVIGAGVTVLDLSERKRREAEILKSRAKLRAILDTAVEAIITIDGRGLIQTINPATERLFGYAAAEMIGQNVKILMPPPYHEEHDGYIARYKQTGEKRIIGIGREVLARRKDGTVFPIDLAVSEVEPGTLFTGIIRDLSERKLMEANLRAAERMATIGTVAAGLGHDINNLLLALRVDANVLDTCSLKPQGATAVRSLRNVTAYLRDLARGLQLIALSPEDMVDGASRATCLMDWYPAAEALLKTVTRSGVGIKMKIPPGLPEVQIAPHQLTQIVFNLVSNSIHAVGDAPRPAGNLVQVSAARRTGENGVRLQIADNCGGMPSEVLARAFEPHFTTRAGRGGTGMGLALVKRLVTEAGGEVSIKSKPGRGTTVTIDLLAAPKDAATDASEADGQTAVVTIADAQVAALVRRVLENLGTPVRSDQDPQRANIWIADPAEVDVKVVKRWKAERPQQRRLVLFGGPPPSPASTWEAIQPLMIDNPDDFEGLRATIARAVTAS